MTDSIDVDRREFTVAAALAMLGGATITISGCGGGSSPTSSGPVDIAGSISDNHGHHVLITAADLRAGGALHLDIAGMAGHSHMIDLSADDIVKVRSGQVVAVSSTDTQAHHHTVSFLAPAPGPGSSY